MSDLFKKLNTLIQAGINDVLDDAQKTMKEPLKHIPSNRLGKTIIGEVDHLREKINDALNHEDILNARIQDLEGEIADLDRQADEAVRAGDDVNARYLLERMKRAQQRLTMTQSDLREHQVATRELMQRVNELDAAIADAKHAVQQKEQAANIPQELAPTPSRGEAVSIPVTVQVDEDNVPANTPPKADAQPKVEKPSADTTPKGETAEQVVERVRAFNEQTGRKVADVLQEAREKINQMNELIESRDEVTATLEETPGEQVQEAIQKQAIDDDIAARRARLAGPPKPQKPSDSSTD
jgi:phage shock protein A